MMKYILIALSILLVVFTTIYILTKQSFILVKFNSRHPQISITKSDSYTFNLYSNIKLQIKSKNIWGVKPKLIGIIYTDKARADNKIINDERDLDFSSTIDVINGNEIIIYIYVSENVASNNNAKKRIRDYTIDTIQYYQNQDKVKSNNLFSGLVRLPINVKDN